MYNEPVPELWHSLKDLSEQGRVRGLEMRL